MPWVKIAAIASGILVLISLIVPAPAWVLPVAVLVLCVGLLIP